MAYSPLYSASGGLLGVNPDMDKKIYIMLMHPRAMFFEFLPMDKGIAYRKGQFSQLEWRTHITSEKTFYKTLSDTVSKDWKVYQVMIVRAKSLRSITLPAE